MLKISDELKFMNIIFLVFLKSYDHEKIQRYKGLLFEITHFSLIFKAFIYERIRSYQISQISNLLERKQKLNKFKNKFMKKIAFTFIFKIQSSE